MREADACSPARQVDTLDQADQNHSMCRYGITYKPHYACFEYRKAFRRRLASDIGHRGPEKPAKCPQCALSMADMGLDFKACTNPLACATPRGLRPFRSSLRDPRQQTGFPAHA